MDKRWRKNKKVCNPVEQIYTTIINLWQLPQNIIGKILTLNSEFVIGYNDANVFYKKSFKFRYFSCGEYLLIDYYYCGRSKDLNELIKMRKLSRILGFFYIPLFLFPYLIVQNNAYKKTKSAMEMREIIDKSILSKILKKINL